MQRHLIFKNIARNTENLDFAYFLGKFIKRVKLIFFHPYVSFFHHVAFYLIRHWEILKEITVKFVKENEFVIGARDERFTLGSMSTHLTSCDCEPSITGNHDRFSIYCWPSLGLIESETLQGSGYAVVEMSMWVLHVNWFKVIKHSIHMKGEYEYTCKLVRAKSKMVTHEIFFVYLKIWEKIL